MNMTDSLVVFFAAVGVVLLAFALAFKSVIRNMVNLAAESVPAYWMAYLKLAVGALIAAGITFKATWQPVGLAETVHWASWDWAIHIGEPILAMLLYIQGFLDRSMERAEAVKAKGTTGKSTPPFPVATDAPTSNSPSP